jgi:hypothetical protein
MAALETFHVPEATCPGCARKADGAASLAGKGAPSPGDLTVCIGCGIILVYATAMTLRRATHEELEALAPETAEDLRRVRRAVETFRLRRR